MSLRTGHERFEPHVADLLLRSRKQNNPRSSSKLASVDGVPYHLKWAPTDLEVEARQLERAATVPSSDGVQALELAHYDRSRNVLITRHVEGESVFNRLYNNFTWRRFLSRHEHSWPEVLTALPKWLSAYHELSPDTTSERASARACSTWLSNSFQSKLEKVAQHPGSPLAPGEIDRLLDHVGNAMNDEAWLAQPVCTIHGDFALTNFLIDADGRVHIMDFADARTAFALEDFVRLWCGYWEVARSSRAGAQMLSPILSRLFPGCEDLDTAGSNVAFSTLRLWNAVVRVAESCLTPWPVVGRSTRALHTKLTAMHLRFIRNVLDERPRTES